MTVISADRWFHCYRPRQKPRLRLVCFPHAGGAASSFRHWARRLPPDLELLAVQYPGRFDRLREECVDDLHRLADQVCDALTPRAETPMALFGHSMGATLAYEVALRLEARRMPSVHLFVSSHVAPQCHKGGRRHLLDDDALWEALRHIGGTSEQVLAHPELRAVFLPLLRRDFRTAETYRPRPCPRLRCPVSVLLGDADAEVPVEEARRWSEVTNCVSTLRIFEGDHFYLVPREAEVVEEVLKHLGAASTPRMEFRPASMTFRTPGET